MYHGLNVILRIKPTDKPKFIDDDGNSYYFAILHNGKVVRFYEQEAFVYPEFPSRNLTNQIYCTGILRLIDRGDAEIF